MEIILQGKLTNDSKTEKQESDKSAWHPECQQQQQQSTGAKFPESHNQHYGDSADQFYRPEASLPCTKASNLHRVHTDAGLLVVTDTTGVLAGVLYSLVAPQGRHYHSLTHRNSLCLLLHLKLFCRQTNESKIVL